jgi:hypothetical protein
MVNHPHEQKEEVIQCALDMFSRYAPHLFFIVVVAVTVVHILFVLEKIPDTNTRIIADGNHLTLIGTPRNVMNNARVTYCTRDKCRCLVSILAIMQPKYFDMAIFAPRRDEAAYVRHKTR